MYSIECACSRLASDNCKDSIGVYLPEDVSDLASGKNGPERRKEKSDEVGKKCVGDRIEF